MFNRHLNSGQKKNKPIGHLQLVMSTEKLLKHANRGNLLQEIYKFMGFSQQQSDLLCLPLIHQVLQYCQQLPDSTCHYYSDTGGLVDYLLNRTHAALELLPLFLLPNDLDLRTDEQRIWIYALFTAGMLQGLGKLYTDYNVDFFDQKGGYLDTWNPLLEKSLLPDQYYDFQFKQIHEHDCRRRVNLCLAKQLMPLSGLEWISSSPEIFEIWLALVYEDDDSAGMLGALLSRAKIIAQQRYLEDFLSRHEDRHPPRVSSFVDVPAQQLIEEKNLLLGAKFLQWLTYALANGHLQLNKYPDCLLLQDGLFIGVEVFKQFVRSNPQYKNWRTVQHALESWRLKQSNLNNDAYGKHMGSLIDLSVIPDVVHEYHAVSNKVDVRSSLKVTQTSPQIQQLNLQGKWLDVAAPQVFLQSLRQKNGF